MTATLNENSAELEVPAKQYSTELRDSSSKKNGFYQGKLTDFPLPNSILVRTKTTTAKNQIKAIKVSNGKDLGFMWRGGKWDKITKKFEFPDLAFYSVPIEKRQDLSLAIKNLEIPGNELDLENRFFPVMERQKKHVREALRMQADGIRFEQAAQKLKSGYEKEIAIARRLKEDGTLAEKEYEDRVLEIDECYKKTGQALCDEANRNYRAADTTYEAGEHQEATESALAPFSLSEIKKAIIDEEVGDASLFKKLADGNFLFYPDEKAFYRWNGTRWSKDIEFDRKKLLIKIAELYETAANFISGSNDKLEEAFRKRAKSLKTVRRQNPVLEMAQIGRYGRDGLVFPGDWDNSPGKIPCSNGLIDIKNGELLKPDRNHFIRKSSSVQYDPDASFDEFHSFVLEIMNGLEERAAFLRRFFGYASLGNPIEDRLLFLWGEHGRNGKGTLVRCICSVLGDLARTFSPELVLLQRNPPSSSMPRPDLINLKGTRIAMFSEINKGREIDSAILKNLTGRDTIAARSLFSNDIKNFTPTHTIILQANHKPKAPSEDIALWRRFILVPFDCTFIDEPDPNKPHEKKVDRSLEERLLKNPSGILRWLLDGAADYQKQGLAIPQDISAATEAYRQENDGIGSFIREHCVIDKTLSIKRSEITKAIQDYCVDNKFECPSRNEICDHLRDLGFKEERDRTGGWWKGLSIQRDSKDSG